MKSLRTSAVITNFTITDTPTVGLSYYDQEIQVRAGDTTLTKDTRLYSNKSG